MTSSNTMDIPCDLPHPDYYDFVRSLLPGETKLAEMPDPFTTDPPDSLRAECFLARKSAERIVEQPGSKIIVSERGMGKSELFRLAPRVHTSASSLVVKLGLNCVPSALHERELVEGKASILSPSLLCGLIFDAYWALTMRDSSRRYVYLQGLRSDRDWMKLLRCYYQHRCPVEPELDDFELMAWLQTPLPGANPLTSLSDAELLRQLVGLVTRPISSRWGPVPGFRGYTRIQLFLDDTEPLSPGGMKRLFEDAQQLFAMGLSALDITIFLDSVWRVSVMGQDCVREGRVPVLTLPEWSPEQLRDLLRQRISVVRGEGPGSSPLNGLDEFLKSQLNAHVRERVEGLVVEAARGSPLRALRLARRVTAACASCRPTSKALGEQSILDLVQLQGSSR